MWDFLNVEFLWICPGYFLEEKILSQVPQV
jgi:hypothetical protein